MAVSAPSETQIFAALDQVMDPEINHSLVELGLIREVEIIDGRVHVDIQLTTPHCPFADEIIHRIRSTLLEMDGVDDVQVDRACTQDD